MKELVGVRVQYATRQQCCKTHKRPLPFTFFGIQFEEHSWMSCVTIFDRVLPLLFLVQTIPLNVPRITDTK
jgi:hypothetical protein